MKRILCLAVAAAAFAVLPARAANTVVVMDTSMGTIKIELADDKAPITVKNFLGYVDDKFYDNTIFHRVIADFMIQGGGFTAKDHVEKKTNDPIKNESNNGLLNKRGTIAMARTNQPNSATAQFFINVKDNDFLDRAKARDGIGYAVFGTVIEGMDVVDKIRAVKTGKGSFVVKTGEKVPFGDAPVEDVVIKSIRRAEKK